MGENAAVQVDELRFGSPWMMMEQINCAGCFWRHVFNFKVKINKCKPKDDFIPVLQDSLYSAASATGLHSTATELLV